MRWTTTTDMLEAAIRFEPAAWRPERIDPVQGTATTAEHSVRLRNPLDYYRHLALSDVLGEPDGAEFMVCEEVLFRIDAAAAGWFLFSFFVRQLLPSATEDGTAAPLDLSPQIRVTLEGLRRDAAPGYQVYVEMLSQIATWAEMPTYLAGDLRTCPAAEATYKEQPPLADAIEAYLRRQQLAIKTLLL